jgi:hypothetical protein
LQIFIFLLSWYLTTSFALAGVVGAISNLSSVASQVSRMKDWENYYDYNVEDTNSILRRIELTCYIIAPFFFSVIKSIDVNFFINF